MSGRQANSSLTMEYSLIGLLYDHPMHGYELSRSLRARSGLGIIWRVKQSNLYGILAKLGTRGLVEADELAQPNRPNRKVFHLTDAGRKAFLSWIRCPVTHGRSVRLDFIAKFYFACKIDLDAARELIAGQRRACAAWYEANRRRKTAPHEDEDFDRLVYDFRAGQLRSMIDWLDECDEFIAKRNARPAIQA